MPSSADDSGSRSVGPLLYCAGFALMQFALLVAVLFVSSKPWFLTHDDYPAMLQSGYGMRLQHRDCDVVLYGDSSALTGLDPDIVQSETGLKSCNIAESGGVEDVVGIYAPLDAYLKNNKRPQYLVMMFNPAAFIPDGGPFSGYRHEGMIYAMQYIRSPAVVLGLLRRPTWILNFDVWAGHSLIEFGRKHVFGRGTGAADPIGAHRDDRDGIWTVPRPPNAGCEYQGHDPATIIRRADSVAAIRSRYTVEGTRVILDIAPISSCNVLRDLYRKQSEGLRDNDLGVLSDSSFNYRDVHFTAEGASQISRQVSGQILTMMAEDELRQAVKRKPQGDGRADDIQ
jgi:hypothetical protein